MLGAAHFDVFVVRKLEIESYCQQDVHAANVNLATRSPNAA